jgi:hypothetical protein
MMFSGSKLFLPILLSSGSLLKKQQMSAECEDSSKAAEQGAADLDKIFGQAAAEGGIPPDPEEIQELLMKAQGRTIR